MDFKKQITDTINKSIIVKEDLLKNNMIDKINKAVNLMIKCYKNNNKVLLCGNGGSAADAQHIAAELSGKFYKDRPPLFAQALHVNTSYLTAIANDYSYEYIFERLIESNGRSGDILVGLSTSGNSKNVLNAMKKAKDKGLNTIGFTGETGGRMKKYSDILLNAPSKDTPRIQEAHILIGHILCKLVEEELFKEQK